MIHIYFAFPIYVVDPKNYKNPISISYHNVVFNMDRYLKREAFLSFTNELIITDNGWVFESMEEVSFISLVKSETELEIRGDKNIIFSANIDSPLKRRVITRKYMKIQDFLGNLGGFIDCLFFFFHILIGGYVDFKFNINTYNNILAKIAISKHKFTSHKKMFKLRTEPALITPNKKIPEISNYNSKSLFSLTNNLNIKKVNFREEVYYESFQYNSDSIYENINKTDNNNEYLNNFKSLNLSKSRKKSFEKRKMNNSIFSESSKMNEHEEIKKKELKRLSTFTMTPHQNKPKSNSKYKKIRKKCLIQIIFIIFIMNALMNIPLIK